MAKRLLLVCLSFWLACTLGCAELKKLRKENTGLKNQLKLCQDQSTRLTSERDAMRSAIASMQARAADAEKQKEQLQRLVDGLQAERMKLDQQRRELQGLVKDLTVETRAEGNFIVYESDIIFAPGKVELNDEAKQSLDKIADYLLQHPDLPVRVDGHTDGVPIKVSQWDDNYHLSAMRALAVMRYIASKGVDPKRMHVAGFGPNKPRVQPEAPAQAIAENRRVEILLVPPTMRSIDEILEGFEH